MKITKYNLLFLCVIINATILSLIDLSFWLENGIGFLLAIIETIIFRNKFN